MNLRLQLELLFRRHGPARIGAYLTVLFIALTGLTAMHTPTVPNTPVEATDGRRQLADRYRAFLRVLVPASKLEALQLAILEAAAEHRLSTGPVDFNHESNTAGPFATTRLQISLNGRYTDLRDFLLSTLHRYPAVALDDLSIQQAANGQGVQARLRFTIHTAPPAGAAS